MPSIFEFESPASTFTRWFDPSFARFFDTTVDRGVQWALPTMFLDTYFYQAGQALGMPPDHLKIVFSIFMTYPYAYLYNRLPNNPAVKHLYSIVLTCGTMLWFHRLYAGFAHIIASATMTYVLTKYWKDKRAPIVNFILLMIHMSIR